MPRLATETNDPYTSPPPPTPLLRPPPCSPDSYGPSCLHPPPPTPTSPPPGTHHTKLIVAICVPVAGLLLLALLAALFLRRRKKKEVVVAETGEVVTDRVHVEEVVVPGPCGPEVVAVKVEEDVEVREETRTEIIEEGASGGDHHHVHVHEG